MSSYGTCWNAPSPAPLQLLASALKRCNPAHCQSHFGRDRRPLPLPAARLSSPSIGAAALDVCWGILLSV